MEKIYYALGELAYIVAAVDGKVQNEEIVKLHKLVVEEIKKKNNSFEYSDIIFNVLNNEKIDIEHVYKYAFVELNEASNYVTDEVKIQIINVLKAIAGAFGGVDALESEVINRIEKDLKNI